MVVEIATVTIALAAVGLTVFQAWETRRHNRLSVRPHLVLESIREDELVVELCNCGFGPALITSCSLVVGGRSYPPTPHGWAELNAELKLPIGGKVGGFGQGAVLQAGQRYPLITFPLPTAEVAEDLTACLSRVAIRCSFASLYSEQQPEFVGKFIAGDSINQN